MTIKKAIQTLEYCTGGRESAYNPDFYHAVKLGIEALKRIERQRFDLEPCERKLLPGETEE